MQWNSEHMQAEHNLGLGAKSTFNSCPVAKNCQRGVNSSGHSTSWESYAKCVSHYEIREIENVTRWTHHRFGSKMSVLFVFWEETANSRTVGVEAKWTFYSCFVVQLRTQQDRLWREFRALVVFYREKVRAQYSSEVDRSHSATEKRCRGLVKEKKHLAGSG